jgi:phosphoribosyl 1,2-cyclic phosphate phosphodiesterase
MKITFLGTGTSQGVPPIGCNSDVCLSNNPKDKRLRASIHVEWDGLSFVVDTGPDFRYQIIRAGINHIDAVLYTHEHRDHTAGLDDIRPFNYLQDMKIPLYCENRVLESFKMQYDYIFEEFPYPGIPLVNFNIIQNEPFVILDKTIIPIQVMHYKLPVFGFRFDSFAYITDANFIADAEIEKLKGVKVLVLNALRREAHISHFTLDEAVELALKIGAEQTYFTHMSHQIGLHDEVCNELPKGIDLAFDGQVIVI